MDFSSAFNTIVPQKLFEKLLHLSVPLSLCYWILHFLVDRSQSVKLNHLQSCTIVLNTGVPQGCVLSLLLYSFFTNDCISHHSSVQLIKFADDTTAERLIENSDESSYHQEVDRLLSWCGNNNLELNTSKTKAMIIDDLFQLLPSGRRYRVLRACTNRLSSSFFHQAIGALNLNLTV